MNAGIPNLRRNKNNLTTSVFNSILIFAYLLIYPFSTLTQDIFIGYKYFIYIVIPIAFIPARLKILKFYNFILVYPVGISLDNPKMTLKNARSKVFISCIAYMLSIYFSSLIAPKFNMGWALQLLEYLMAVSCFLLITARVFRMNKFSTNFFVPVISFVISLNALINLYYLYLNEGIADVFKGVHYRFVPSFGHIPDHFSTTSASTYALFVSSLIACALLRSSIQVKLFYALCSIILSCAVVLSYSRGALLGIFGCLSFYAYLSKCKTRNVIIIATVIFIVIYLMLPSIGASFFERGDNFRFQVWSSFLDLAIERPILGYGERIEFAIPINGLEIGHAHNLIIGGLIRGGILGFISMVSILFLCLNFSLKFYLLERNPIPLFMSITFVCFSIFDFELIIFLLDWQWITFWFPIGLVIGIENFLAKARSRPIDHLLITQDITFFE